MDAQAKTTERGECKNHFGAVSSMRGRRFTMEDEHILNFSFLDRFFLFAVFDGHGGDLTAKYCRENFSQLLTLRTNSLDFTNDEAITQALKESFIELDMRICTRLGNEKNESGSTAVCAIVTDDKIIVANCGDSRSVLGSSGTTIPMSLDHKPTQKLERARIKDAGGIVVLGRVNGDLAVSRAIGDLSYKDKTKEPEKELVSCVPDVKIHIRRPTDEVLLLACDGIWDVMKSEEAVESFKKRYRDSTTQDIGTICEEMLAECYEKGSSDNMTLICVKFPGLDFDSTTNAPEESKNEETKEVEITGTQTAVEPIEVRNEVAQEESQNELTQASVATNSPSINQDIQN